MVLVIGWRSCCIVEVKGDDKCGDVLHCGREGVRGIHVCWGWDAGIVLTVGKSPDDRRDRES